VLQGELRETAMERRKVSSSGIRSVGYDASAQLLEVELSDGSIWQYSKVSGEVHRRFIAAPSMVSYYRDNIEEAYSRRRIK
jgi:YD repeat-containing protein